MPEPSGPDPGQDSVKFRGDAIGGAGAARGNASWTSHGTARSGDELTLRLVDLQEKIDRDIQLPTAERSLATAKIDAIIYALRHVNDQPHRLHEALLDANVFLTARVAWAWQPLQSALQDEAARAIMSRITVESVRDGIDDLLRRG